MDKPTDNQAQGQVEGADLLSGDDFESIIKAMMAQADPKPNEDENDPEHTDDQDIPDNVDDDVEYDDEYEDEEEELESESEKKVQTPEERKAQAAARRQREFEAKVQEELQKRVTDLPEMQVARELARMYNTTPEQMLHMVRQAELEKQAQIQAQRDGIPVEVVKRTLDLEQQLNQLRFEQWKSGIETQRPQLLKDFPMLNDDDVNAAIYYQTEVLKQPQMPLQQAVWAIHGQKIMDGMQKNLRQENLAEKSGRKKSPLPMQGGGKSSTSVTLTSEEQYIAKKFGMTDEEYLKYKSND